MTGEATTHLSPTEALESARDFFAGENAVYEAPISEESEGHVLFSTFRSRIAVAAFPDPRGEAPTRVRVSTLREHAMADRFLTYLRSASSGAAATEGADR